MRIGRERRARAAPFWRALSNYVVVMKSGKVVEEGPSARIFDNPREAYTKALLAAAFDLTAKVSSTGAQASERALARDT